MNVERLRILTIFILVLAACSPVSAFAQTDLKKVESPGLSKIHDILQKTADLVAGMEDNEFIEGCCPARMWKVGILTALAGVQAKAGDLTGLRTTARLALETAEPASMYPLQLASVGYSQATMRDREGAVITLNVVLDGVTRIDDERVRDSVLPVIVRGFGAVGERERVLFAAGMIKDDLSKAIAYSHAAGERAKTTDDGGYEVFLREAIKVTDRITNGRDKSAALRAVAKAQWQANDSSAARQSMKEALVSATGLSDPADRADALSWLAWEHVEMGNVGEAKLALADALSAARRIDGDNDRADRLWRIAWHLTRAGDPPLVTPTLQEAVDSANKVQDGFLKANALREIGEVYTKAGNTRAARNLFEQAHIVKGRTPSRDAYTLLYLAKAEADAGDAETANRTAQGLGAVTDAEVPTDYAYFYIALAQAQSGEFNGALRSLRAIRAKADLKAEASQEIARKLTKRGNHGDVLLWADSLPTAQARARAYLGVAQGLLE